MVAGKEDEPENVTIVTPTSIPTVTPTPSPTKEPVAGVDYAIAVPPGVRLMVVGTERLARMVDGNGTLWTPEDNRTEILVVYLALGKETQTEALSGWFGDASLPFPAVIDRTGQSRRWSFASLETDPESEALVLQLFFLIKKGERQYVLVLPGGARVDLTQVADFTPKPARIGYLRAI